MDAPSLRGIARLIGVPHVGGGEKGGQFGGQEGTTCVVTPWTWTAWPGPLIVVWLPCGNFRCPTATAPFFDATAGVLMIFEVHA